MHAKGQFLGKVMPGHARRHSAVSCAKNGWMWTWVGPRKHVHGTWASRSPTRRTNFKSKKENAMACPTTLFSEPCKNGSVDRITNLISKLRNYLEIIFRMTLTGHRIQTRYYIIYNPALQWTEQAGWGARVQNDYPPQELAVQSLPIPVRPTRHHVVQI